MRRVLSLLRNAFRRQIIERHLDDELQSCIQILADEKIANGARPDEARRQSLIELGGVEQVRIRVREARMGAFLEILLQDIRFGLRTFGKSKRWTMIVVLSLGLGIGANTVMFSLINGLLLRTIPVSDPQTLVRLRWAGPADVTGLNDNAGAGTGLDAWGHELRSQFSRSTFERLRTGNQTLSDLFACDLNEPIVIANGEAELASALIASGNYYETLGIRPALGRLLTLEDDRSGATPAAVIGYGYWARRFGKDPSVIGRVITVDGIPFTIIGVSPQEFMGVQSLGDPGQDITVPLAFGPQLEQNAPDSYWHLQLMGRLKPGITAAQVAGNLDGTFQAAAFETWTMRTATMTTQQRTLPRNRQPSEIPHLVVQSGSRGLYDVDAETMRASVILTIVVAMVLMIVCANAANLMLARSAARRWEISVRLSIGASRRRLIGQLVTESLLMATAGSVIGLVINHWGREALPFGRAAEVGKLPVSIGATPELDWRIVAFTFAVTLLSALIFGLLPALRATRIDLVENLKRGSGPASGGSLTSQTLLVAQVAISLVLLIGAGLFLRTVSNLRHVAVGFNTQHILTFRISAKSMATQATAGDQARMTAVYEEMVDGFSRIAGVRSVGASLMALLSSRAGGSRVYLPGMDQSRVIDGLPVSPSFFETMQIPILAGRGFDAHDMVNPPNTVIVNEAFAREFFPGKDPIGQHVGVSPGNPASLEIIGLTRDIKYGDIHEAAKPTEFTPVPPTPRSLTFELRTDGNPRAFVSSIRDVVRDIDPTIPLEDIATQAELLEGRIKPERLFTLFYTFFGAIALLMASIGLFGLMSYNVVRRTNEIGIRMALGAQRGVVLRMILRESLMLVASGVILGIGLALAGNRLIASQLFGLAPNDFLTILVAVSVLLSVSAFAAYLPARRASRVDPTLALRYE